MILLRSCQLFACALLLPAMALSGRRCAVRAGPEFRRRFSIAERGASARVSQSCGMETCALLQDCQTAWPLCARSQWAHRTVLSARPSSRFHCTPLLRARIPAATACAHSSHAPNNRIPHLATFAAPTASHGTQTTTWCTLRMLYDLHTMYVVSKQVASKYVVSK